MDSRLRGNDEPNDGTSRGTGVRPVSSHGQDGHAKTSGFRLRGKDGGLDDGFDSKGTTTARLQELETLNGES